MCAVLAVSCSLHEKSAGMSVRCLLYYCRMTSKMVYEHSSSKMLLECLEILLSCDEQARERGAETMPDP